MYIPTLADTYFAHAKVIQLYFPSKSNKLGRSSIVMRALKVCQDLEALWHVLPNTSFYVDHEDKMAKNNSDFTLIDYRLSDDELDVYDAWVLKEKPQATGVLVALAEKDYKVSMSYVENSESWCISITGKEGAKFNTKCTLTTWNDDPIDGLFMATWKALVLFDGGKWKTKTQSKRG